MSYRKYYYSKQERFFYKKVKYLECEKIIFLVSINQLRKKVSIPGLKQYKDVENIYFL